MSSPLKYLLQRTRGGDLEASRKLAATPDATDLILDELAQSSDLKTRLSVAQHPNTSDETLGRMIYDIDAAVAAAVATRSGLSDSQRSSLEMRAAADFTVKRGRDRAHTLDLVIAICNNTETPMPAVTQLMKNIATSHLPRLMAKEASRPELLTVLISHPKATVRQALVDNPALPPKMLAILCRDANEKVSEAAGRLSVKQAGGAQGLARQYATLKADQGDDAATAYENAVNELWSDPKERQGILNFLAGHPPENAVIIELGCGAGILTQHISQKYPGASITAVDISPKLIAVAKERCKGINTITWQLGDFNQPLDLSSNSADLITSWHSLHNAPNMAEPFSEILRILKPGGRFMATIPCLADEREENLILADLFLDLGYTILPYSDLMVEIGTCGLVIEELSSQVQLTPNFTDPSALKRSALPHFQELLTACKNNSLDLSKTATGFVKINGKKVLL